MLDAREIDHAIAQLEYEESSYPNYQKLSSLYIIRDHMQPKPEPVYEAVDYSAAPAPAMELYGDSDFLQAAAGKDPYEVWNIIDDLMDTLHTVNSRVYESVMRKINAL